MQTNETSVYENIPTFTLTQMSLISSRSCKNRNFMSNFQNVKCFVTKFPFLGHRISADGLSIKQDKLQAILDWPTPKFVKDIQSFLVAASYYRQFINLFAQISVPLTNLLQKDANWEWTHTQQQSFDSLKHAMIQAPVLMNPDYKREFIITPISARHWSSVESEG